MNLFFFHHPVRRQDEESFMREIVANDHPHNTSEGSEFLDDAIRIIDQPLIYPDETVAPGCPEDIITI